MTMDEDIVKIITLNEKFINSKYPQYFLPEIKPFLTKPWFPKNTNKYSYSKKENWIDVVNKREIPNDFYENRKIGENENFICELIRRDSVEEFVEYVNQKNISLEQEIIPSIYETNSLLIKIQTENEKRSTYSYNQSKDDKMTLIKYATFFGSIQIIQYLKYNGIDLTSSLWIFAIHSNNPEVIHLLEENQIKQTIVKIVNREEVTMQTSLDCIYESIKCHHNDIANYIQDSNFHIARENIKEMSLQSIRYYNFALIQNDFINMSSFSHFCHYDYYQIVDNYMKDKDVNLNEIIIQYFKLYSLLYYSMKFKFEFYITPLFWSIYTENMELFKLLMSSEKIDTNVTSILIIFFF